MQRLILAIILSWIFMPVPFSALATEFHLSPDGNDNWPGTSEKPFASLEKARQAVRDLKAKAPLAEPVVITLHEGTYYLSETLQLTHDDSGTKSCPITWQAAPGAKPVVSGGRKIGPWTKYNDRLFVADVKSIVSENFFPGDFFVNSVRAEPARTPNAGTYYYTKQVLVTETKGNPCYGFRYNPTDVGDWVSDPDLRVKLYQHWSNSLNKIKSVDRKKNEILFERSLGRFLPAATTRYYFVNFFDALDSPGEWFYDRGKGKMFYYPRPGENLSKDDTIAACLVRNLIEVQGDYRAGKPVAYLNFKGITFKYTRPNFADDYEHSVQGANTQQGAFFAVGMEHCLIENCVFAHLGEHGITLWDGCHHNTIRRNRIHDLGGGGVYLSKAAPKETDDAFMTSHNIVDNNLIHDGGYHFAAACGIFMAGSAPYNKILHNEICNFYYTGLHAGWSWSGTDKAYTHHNEFGYNHVHHVGCGVMSDLGGVYFLGISTGTDFHDNHLHHITRYQNGYGGWGIYFDAGSSNILVRNNVVHDTDDGGLHLHCYAYPRGNIIENNIFAFARNGELQRGAVMEPDSGLHAKLSKNILCSTSEKMYYGSNWKKGGKFSTDYNCLWTTSKEPLSLGGRTLEAWQKEGNDSNSIVKDPLFVDRDKRDFRLRQDSPVFALGFKAIDMTKIGLYGDPDWVQSAKSVKPRPCEIVPPPPFYGIHEDYEAYQAGVRPSASVYEEGKNDTVRVVEKEGVRGGKCLKFTDAPGLKWVHDPHMAISRHFPDGNLVSSFKLRFEPGSMLQYQWRDYEGSAFYTGPAFNVTGSGAILVGGKKLTDIPHGQWVSYEIYCSTGAKANGRWTLKVTIPGQPVKTFENLQCQEKFKSLSWIGYISSANDTAVFYLDDLAIELKK